MHGMPTRNETLDSTQAFLLWRPAVHISCACAHVSRYRFWFVSEHEKCCSCKAALQIFFCWVIKRTSVTGSRMMSRQMPPPGMRSTASIQAGICTFTACCASQSAYDTPSGASKSPASSTYLHSSHNRVRAGTAWMAGTFLVTTSVLGKQQAASAVAW